MANMEFISAFLSEVEGPRQTRGYIPCNHVEGWTLNYRGDKPPDGCVAMGASGVTIATGCDLGQTDAATLRSYGLAQGVIAKYQRYLGKRKDAALRSLYAYPLQVSMADAVATDMAVHRGYLARNTRPAYDKASRVKFDDLPKEAQAVIMSVTFQKGCRGVAKDWPKLWSFLTSQNWQAARNELYTGFIKYKGRRKAEGDMLEAIC